MAGRAGEAVACAPGLRRLRPGVRSGIPQAPSIRRKLTSGLLGPWQAQSESPAPTALRPSAGYGPRPDLRLKAACRLQRPKVLRCSGDVICLCFTVHSSLLRGVDLRLKSPLPPQVPHCSGDAICFCFTVQSSLLRGVDLRLKASCRPAAGAGTALFW